MNFSVNTQIVRAFFTAGIGELINNEKERMVVLQGLDPEIIQEACLVPFEEMEESGKGDNDMLATINSIMHDLFPEAVILKVEK